jgi:hypothetical protein
VSDRKIVQVYEGWSWQILLCAGENHTKSMGKYARCTQVGLLSFALKKQAEEAMGIYYDLGYEPIRCYGKIEDRKWDPKKDKREVQCNGDLFFRGPIFVGSVAATPGAGNY